MTKQWLLIDADDTLWENNIYFEQAFDEFVQLLDPPQLSPGQVREILDSIEIENIRVNGYGAQNFGRNMQQCLAGGRTYPAAAAQPRPGIRSG